MESIHQEKQKSTRKINDKKEILRFFTISLRYTN
jgi:hypothetical protein